MRCLCFISPLTKKEALQTATFTPLLAALLNELKPFSIYTWKYTTHKKIRVMVSVQAFLLTVKNCGGGTAWCTEIFIWMRKKHRLLIGDWSWKVYRFFRKDDWGVKHLTIGLKKTPAAWNLYESAKYESLHCGCQTRLSCVAKRAPWTETRGVKCFGWLYSAVWYGRHDLMLLFLHCSMGGLCLILYCHLLAPWASDLCSFISTVCHWWIVGMLPKSRCTSCYGAKVNHPRELKGRKKHCLREK